MWYIYSDGVAQATKPTHVTDLGVLTPEAWISSHASLGGFRSGLEVRSAINAALEAA